MKIFGIGTDIVNIKRIENSLKRRGSSFKKKYFLKKKFYIVTKRKIHTLIMQKGLLLRKLLVKR